MLKVVSLVVFAADFACRRFPRTNRRRRKKPLSPTCVAFEEARSQDGCRVRC